jgi:hypothetical protein
MPHRRPSHLALIMRHPLKLLLSIYHASALLSLVLLHRLLLPFSCRATAFGTEVRRCLLGGLLANFWDLLFKQAPGVQWDKHYTEVCLRRVPAVVVPPNAISAQDQAESGTNVGVLPSRARQSVVLLYAHGGGYLFGEPLMYLSTYKRWTRKCKALGFDLIVVSVDYSTLIPALSPAESSVYSPAWRVHADR